MSHANSGFLSPVILSPFLAWQREITDALILYSISIIACAATFNSPLFDNFVQMARARDGLSGEKITIILLFFGMASAFFGVRRLGDQRKERMRRLAAEQHANSLSLRDPLTLLPNRRCLEHELGAAITRAGGNLTVLLAGLKRFDIVNNLHGHSGGDAVLSQVAARLRQEFGRIGFLARVADDEFALVLSHEDADGATRVARSLVEHMRRPLRIGIHEHAVEAHVGIAQLDPALGTFGEVLRHAHIALDRARNLDTDCCFFDAEMDTHISARALLEQDFRSALASNAIRVHFQPIIDLRSGKIVSFEALARWTHPQQGVISPAVFIPLTEDLGLMDRLSEQLFRDACRQASTWPEPISLSFNFTPGQLSDPSFGASILAMLAAAGLPPHRLEAEITEGALVSDFTVARQTIRALESAGVRIVMDDFGTGYSGLRHLRELPFDKIKIDGSFVNELSSNPDCAAIVSAAAGLGKSLEIDTVAEGIETEHQLLLARAAGCTHAQGFLFARPRPGSQLDMILVCPRKQDVEAA